MKKIYIAPEMEIVRYKLVDAILASPTESNLPTQDGGGGDLPGGPELDDSDDL